MGNRWLIRDFKWNHRLAIFITSYPRMILLPGVSIKNTLDHIFGVASWQQVTCEEGNLGGVRLEWRTCTCYSSLNRYHSFFARRKIRRNHTSNHLFDELNEFLDENLVLELIGGVGRVFWAVMVRKSCLACRKGAYASISTKDRWFKCMFYHVTIIKDPEGSLKIHKDP